jgi:DNA-binding Lrp family transcriptional regulator
MDETDKRILNSLQADFPVVPKPFAAIAERIGVKEEEVLTRVRRMKDNGLIRRIGAIFESRKLGYVSALCAARVSEEKMASFVEIVNAYEGVTHNYRRNDEYNIWFTFIAPTEEDIQAFLAGIRKKTGIADILCMRAVKTFKVNAQFEV